MKRTLLFALLLILGISICGNVYAQINVTIGNGTTTNTTTGPPSPYGTYWKNFRQQYLVLVPEIEDAGGGAGNINSIAFNVAAVNTCSAMPNYTIRLKHTTQTTLSTTFEAGTYQTVFVQNDFLPVAGWNTHTFTEPFVWDGTSNILVDVFTSIIPGTYTQNSSVYYSTTAFNSSLRFQSDSTEAGTSTTGTASTLRSNIRFNMVAMVVTDPPNPAMIVSPANGAVNVMTSATLNWSSGGGAPAGYKVHFGTTNPPPFVQNTTETSYTPTLGLTTQYFWKIIPFNAVGDAANCPVWSFTTGGPVVVMSNGQQAIPDGVTYSFYDSGGPTGQYQASENYTFTFSATNPVSIIHAMFTGFTLENNWDFLKIYDGPNTSSPQIGPVAGYTGSNMPAEIIGSNALTFVFTSDSSGQYDGWAAAVSAVNLAHDLGAQSISGSSTPPVGTPTTYSIAIKNNGANTESNYTVKLMNAANMELASVPGVTIAPQETININLTYTFPTVGPVVIYGKVVLPDDGIPNNDETSRLNVEVMETGLLVVEIGTGTTTNTNTGSPSPYGTWYKAFRQQLLYKADDFYAGGSAPGLITALAFNVQDLLTCQAMPNFTIRVKNTDQQALGSTFEAGEYTTVWHSDLYMPTTAWNIHNFIAPFFWDGASNLLVEIVTDMIAGSYSYNTLAYLTPTSYNSSLRFQSDSANGSTGTTGTAAMNRTNARFFMILEDMGSLNGVVTVAGAPLAGAEVQVIGTVFNTTTGADGSYNLPHVPVGVQTVSATKHGYNVVTHTVTIVEDQASTQNFALTLLPQVAVTGKIVGSDAPTLGIEGASIALSGYEAYSAITDASGNFTIPNVFASQTYNYTATAIGYASATGQVVVGTVPVNMGTITVNEVAYPPYGVVANQSADFQSVNLSWESPVAGGSGFEDDFEDYADFTLDFGDWTTIDVDGSTTFGFSGITFPNSGTAMSYIIFNPSMTNPPLDYPTHSGAKFAACFASEVAPNNDWMISPQVMGGGEVSFWAATYMDYGLERFKVGVSTTGTQPADFTIISGANYVEVPLAWTEFVYDLTAYSGQQIHVGIQCVSNDCFIFLVDDFYVGDARGASRISTASKATQYTVSDVAAPKMSTIAERASVTPNPVKMLNSTPQNTSRSITGYKVYRLLAANQDNPSLWTTLTTNNIIPTNYTDATWGPLPSGVYKYAVRAIYTNNVQSPAAFSAEIHKGMMGTLSGTVTEFGTNLPVAGATITAGTYSGTSSATGTYSFGVYAGTYAVSCAKPGYQTANQAGVNIVGMQTTTQNFVMTEITLPPGAVQAVEASASTVNVTWMAPGTGGGEWIHYDSGENDDSIGTGGAADFDVAIRYPASALTDYIGMSLYAVKCWPAQAGTFAVRVWTGGSAAAPGPIAADQAFTPNLDVYNTVMLANPVPITGTEELWFGYRNNVTGGYPAGCDAGPATDGFGNMMYFQNAWTTLTALNPDLNYNWNIQGYVGYSAPTQAAGITPISLKAMAPGQNETIDRALTGYKVWRLLQGQESNETVWTQLTPDPITATGWQDTGWGSVPDGTYKWSVKAIYTGGAASIPAFSQALPKITQIGTIAGIVRNQQNAPIMGATVTCGTVNAITNASGAYSMQIIAGTHSVTASAATYAPATQTGVIVVTGATTTVNFQLAPSQDLLVDGFETYTNFAITFAPWTCVDVDQSITYGNNTADWLNEYAAQAFIIMNPSATTPPIADAGANPHAGSKYAACYASVMPAEGGTGPNNDWLITPVLTNPAEIKFWAKSFTADYGLERIKIGVSTTGTAPANFTIISGATYIGVPAVWTEYTYPLTGYTGNVYVGIQCLSNDAFFLMIDDVRVTGGTANEDPMVPVVATELHGNFPNPFNPETTIRYSVKEASPVNIGIYNVKGQLVKTLVNDTKASGNYTATWNGLDNNNQPVSSGVYFYKMHAGSYSSTRKMIMMK